MEAFVTKKKLGDSSYREDREYWLSKTVSERLSAIEVLRRQIHGTPGRLKGSLKLLNENKVEFIIVGGYALGFRGVPRYTGDLDLFISAECGKCFRRLEISG